MLDEAALKRVMGAVLGVDPSTITAETSSDTVKAWDSIRHMTLILAIEEEFKVSIPDEEAADVTSYKLICVVLNELLGA